MALWTLPTAPVKQQVMRANTTINSPNVPTSSSAHTMGAWTTLIATTTYPIEFLVIRGNVHTSTGVASPALLNIGIGATSSEQIVVPYADIGFHLVRTFWVFPCSIPAGIRVAAQVQGARTSTNIGISVDGFGSQGIVGGFPPVASWTNYGIDTANSRGTAVTPGDSNTWGSWVDLGATTYDHSQWQCLWSLGGNSNATAITYRVQLAWGANSTAATACVTAGSHIESYTGTPSTSEQLTINSLPVFPMIQPVPAGEHVWVRAMASGTAQTIYASAYGGR